MQKREQSIRILTNGPRAHARVKAAVILLAAAVSFSLPPFACAQEELARPKLGDIMVAAQWRHIKLWFAGKLENWDLARYEVDRLRESLETAALLYTGIPAEYVNNTADPIEAIRAAIDAKDNAKFVKAYNGLTAACNSCHVQIGRGFIVLQTPSTSPFSDQKLTPP